MSSTATYVENLSDEALYKELKSHGVPAGPVVDSTRRLYKRKLIQILENEDKHSDENVEDEEPPPTYRDNSRWSHFASSTSSRLSYDQEEVPSRLNLSHPGSLYRSYQDKDPVSSYSYTDYQDSSRIPGPSLLSNDSSSSAFRKSLSGLRDEDSFSRMRKPYTETLSRPELSPRFRFTGFSDTHTARKTRYNRDQSKSGLRLIMCGALVVVAILILYIVYNAWSENDPYRQIEEEAKKLIEESDV